MHHFLKLHYLMRAQNFIFWPSKENWAIRKPTLQLLPKRKARHPNGFLLLRCYKLIKAHMEALTGGNFVFSKSALMQSQNT
jgi:hypothetical protein